MVGIIKDLFKKMKQNREEAAAEKKRKAEKAARIANNIAKLKSDDWKERQRAANEASSLDNIDIYNHLIPLIFDDIPEVRKAALNSIGDNLMYDHRTYAPPVVMFGGSSFSDLNSHFSEGQKGWKSSPYYPINKRIVEKVQKLLETEQDTNVKNEAIQTLELARGYLK